ncbi:MAG: hypothetical protein Q8Q14_00680 [Gemmatimonadales bacterium]|nr:hypothetical protein [Gemmatimonadales bacterium]
MTPAEETVARAAVACKSWRWMPRMIDDRGRTVLDVDGRGVPCLWHDPASGSASAYMKPGWALDEWVGAVPDLTDPATRGCLLALVRKAWGDESVHLAPDRKRGGRAWRLSNWDDDMPVHITRRDPAGCLVAALEAAP